MAKVIATQRGYYGGVLREAGDTFGVADDVMEDAKRRPSWVKLATSAMASPAASEPAPVKAPRKPKADTVMAPTAEPFADAPAPVHVANEINAATGATQPDWLAPGDDI